MLRRRGHGLPSFHQYNKYTRLALCYNGAMNTVAKTSHAPHTSYCTHDMDAGNTAIKVFFRDAKNQMQVQRFLTPAILENPISLIDFLKTQNARSIRWRSSLPQALQEALKQMLSLWELHPLEKEDLLPALETWHYDTAQLGLDRMLHIVVARQAVETPCLVVISAGTATTVDFISANTHLGGWIQSGFGVWQEALFKKAPHLTTSFSEEPSYDLGIDTFTALAYGGHRPYVLGLAHAVREQVSTHFKTQTPTVLLTGGYADALLLAGFEEALGVACLVDPYLGAFW
jgi:pantothenate kinase type III